MMIRMMNRRLIKRRKKKRKRTWKTLSKPIKMLLNIAAHVY